MESAITIIGFFRPHHLSHEAKHAYSLFALGCNKSSALSERMQAVQFIFFLGLAVFVMMPLYVLTTLPPLVVMVASVALSAGLVSWVEPHASRWLNNKMGQDR